MESSQLTQLDEGLFARNATGLVREVSPVSTWIFNFAVGAPAYVLAIGIFWTLGVFPGANLYLAIWLVFLLAVGFTFAFGVLSSAMPRSGGDYVLVSRALHPILGIISSFSLCFAVILALGSLALAGVTVAIGPSFAAIGVISDSSTLLDWSTTLATSKAWQIGLGSGLLAVIALVVAAGWQITARFQLVCVALTSLSLLVGCIILLVVGHSEFVSNFNDLAAPITGQADSYGTLVAEGKKAGVAPIGSEPSATWPAMGAIFAFAIYSWWSINFAGEVRRARTGFLIGLMLSVALAWAVTYTVAAVIFLNVFGSDFFGSANALYGTEAYPFAAPPYWTFLASIASGSTALAWFLNATFVPGIFMLLLVNFIMPVRALFAYAFDGLFPMKVSYVSARRRVPTIATLIVFILAEGMLVWAVNSTSFLKTLAIATLVGNVPLTLMAISAITLPYLRPEVFRASAIVRSFLGIPLITWAGVVALLGSAFGYWVFLHYPGLGVTNRALFPEILIGIIVAALAVYVTATRVRAHQGINLRQAYAEIPPE